MPRLRLLGFDAHAQAQVRALFASLPETGWSLADSSDGEADAALIDLDSMAGQLAWMGDRPAGEVSLGLTRAARAGTTLRLEAPLDAATLASGLAAAKQRLGASLVGSGEPLQGTAGAAAGRVEGSSEAPKAANRSLLEMLTEASGGFRIEAPGLPPLVVDVSGARFAPGRSLRALLGYAVLPDVAAMLRPVPTDAIDAALAAAGDVQPLGRLQWLLVLGAGSQGSDGHGPGTRFALTRWPQIEREFPKHFRIATVLLKAPATVAEVAVATGASESEVAAFVRAALAAGYAQVR